MKNFYILMFLFSILMFGCKSSDSTRTRDWRRSAEFEYFNKYETAQYTTIYGYIDYSVPIQIKLYADMSRGSNEYPPFKYGFSNGYISLAAMDRTTVHFEVGVGGYTEFPEDDELPPVYFPQEMLNAGGSSGISINASSSPEGEKNIVGTVEIQSENYNKHTGSYAPTVSLTTVGDVIEGWDYVAESPINIAVYPLKERQFSLYEESSSDLSSRISDIHDIINDLFRPAVLKINQFDYNQSQNFGYDAIGDNLGQLTGAFEKFNSPENASYVHYDPEMDYLAYNVDYIDAAIVILNSSMRYAWRLGEDYNHTDETLELVDGREMPRNRVVWIDGSASGFLDYAINANNLFMWCSFFRQYADLFAGNRAYNHRFRESTQKAFFFLDRPLSQSYSKDQAFLYSDQVVFAFRHRPTDVIVIDPIIKSYQDDDIARILAHELLHTHNIGNNLVDLNNTDNIMYYQMPPGRRLYKSQWDQIHE